MSGDGKGIRLEKTDGVAFVTLDAPPLNILTAAMMDAIAGALADVRADRSLKAAAFTSTGKAFSAGADVGEHRPEQAAEMIAAFSRLFTLLDGLELPIVMAVDGAALGAGFELAMMADVLLASERAKFGQPEIRLGFFAPVGVAWLPVQVGPARAMEITCSGRTYTAAEMQAMGLVSRVVPPGGATSGARRNPRRLPAGEPARHAPERADGEAARAAAPSRRRGGRRRRSSSRS